MRTLTASRLSLAVLLCLVVWTQGALAHETHSYRIGNQTYDITIGSLNEPVAIDDKTGLDLRVNMPGSTPTPVTGLDQTLKVELIAGDMKKVFNIQPANGAPGSYRTSFYPTVQTTLSYRLFGTINNVPVDLTYTCNPAGHPQTPADTNEVKMSDGVTQIARRGAFGCPLAKADLGFPEAAPSAYDLQAQVSELKTALSDSSAQSDSARYLALAGIVSGVLGLLVGGSAFLAMKKNDESSKAMRRSRT